MSLSILREFFGIKDDRVAVDPHYPEVLDPRFGIYSQPYFQKMLSLETKRSERSSRPFLLMLLTVARHMSEEERLYLFKRVALLLRRLTRDIDIKGWHEHEKSMGVIFTEIRPLCGRAVQSRIQQKILEGLLKGLDYEQASKIVISFDAVPNGSGSKLLNGNGADPTHGEPPLIQEPGPMNGRSEATGSPGTSEGAAANHLENTGEGKIEYGFNTQRAILLGGICCCLPWLPFWEFFSVSTSILKIFAFTGRPLPSRYSFIPACSTFSTCTT